MSQGSCPAPVPILAWRGERALFLQKSSGSADTLAAPLLAETMCLGGGLQNRASLPNHRETAPHTAGSHPSSSPAPSPQPEGPSLPGHGSRCDSASWNTLGCPQGAADTLGGQRFPSPPPFAPHPRIGSQERRHRRWERSRVCRELGPGGRPPRGSYRATAPAGTVPEDSGRNEAADAWSLHTEPPQAQLPWR